MASTSRRYGRTATSGEGLEVDLSVAGLHELPESLGIEATPRELLARPAPQTLKPSEKELAHDIPTTAQLQLANSSNLNIQTGSRSSWKSKRFLPLLVVAMIIAVIVSALAIPLALELKKPSKSISSVNSNYTTRVPNKSPTSGAFNGTGLAFIDLDPTGVPDLSIFYQDYNSQIRRLNSIELTPFTGGFPIVASNARNATPLATLTYTTNGDLNSHLYYIDINNTLQEIISADNLTTWQLGSLSDSKFTASVSSTSLTAFYSDHWLGQDGNSTGIRLYYGAPDNQIYELALFPSVGSQYFSQFIFRGTNGNAGLSSAWWDGPGLGNLYVFDENNKFQVWSNNFSTTHNATQNAPYGNWVEDPSDESNYYVKANTALSFGTVGMPPNTEGRLCFQQTSNDIDCVSTSPTTGILIPPSEISDNNLAPAAPSFQNPQQGSALVAAWQPTPGTFPWELTVFYQIESGDIIQNTDASGTWVNTTLPVR